MSQEPRVVGAFRDADESLSSLLVALRTRTQHFASPVHRKGIIVMALAGEPPMNLLWLAAAAVDRLLELEPQ